MGQAFLLLVLSQIDFKDWLHIKQIYIANDELWLLEGMNVFVGGAEGSLYNTYNGFSCRIRGGNQWRYCLLSVTVVLCTERYYIAKVIWGEQRNWFCKWAVLFLAVWWRERIGLMKTFTFWICGNVCVSFHWTRVWFTYLCEPVAHTQISNSSPFCSTQSIHDTFQIKPVHRCVAQDLWEKQLLLEQRSAWICLEKLCTVLSS